MALLLHRLPCFCLTFTFLIYVFNVLYFLFTWFLKVFPARAPLLCKLYLHAFLFFSFPFIPVSIDSIYLILISQPSLSLLSLSSLLCLLLSYVILFRLSWPWCLAMTFTYFYSLPSSVFKPKPVRTPSLYREQGISCRKFDSVIHFAVKAFFRFLKEFSAKAV